MNLILIEDLDDYDREKLNKELSKHGLDLRPPSQEEWESWEGNEGTSWEESEAGYEYYVLDKVTP